jgi:hypothetical protein
MVVISCAAALDDTCSKHPSSRPGDPEPTFGCRARLHADDPLLVGGYEANGLVHFRIAFDGDVEPLQKQAFEAGMAMWNRHSQTTGFVFEAHTTGNVDFRLQRGARHVPNGNEQTDCTGYVSPGFFIWYSPEGMNWVKRDTDITAAARIYAHELGHLLNLCHKCGVTSLMREGDPDGLCRDWARTAPLDIPAEDLRDARICGLGARAIPRQSHTLYTPRTPSR